VLTTIIANRFDAQCGICRCVFATGEGFMEKSESGFRFFCKAHVPGGTAPVARSTPTATSAPVQKPVSSRRLTERFEIITPKEPENLQIFRSFPGARWTGTCWTVSGAEGDRRRVLELADRLGLDVHPSCRTIRRSARAEAAAALALYPYQIDGVDFLAKKQKSLLGDQMGLGKTVQSLLALEPTDRVLAVVPASLKGNWEDEIKRWRPDLRSFVVKSKVKFRWPEPGEIVLISKEMLPDFLTPIKKQGDRYGNAQWTERDRAEASEIVLLVDEAHKFKNYKAACSKKMGQLSRVVKKVIALTGTPLLNQPGDLFGVLSSVGMVGEVFGTWDRFCGLFDASQDRWGGMQWGRPSPEVAERLRRVMLARRREEVLPELPRKQYVDIVVENSRAVSRMLDGLDGEDNRRLLERGELPDFRQFSKVRAQIAQERIEAMVEFVENCEEQEEPLVVFSAHLAPLDTLMVRKGWAVISGDTPVERRQQIVRAFQAGKLKGIGLTVTAGGVGLTLTHACTELFVDLDWVPANNSQAEDRCCRIGQMADKVTVYRMRSNHPLDIHIHRLLGDKIRMIDEAMNQQAEAHVPATAV
jgi:SWI/SNF-related matrix-associated actin-dependent regulator 1 of chromatin subfamily A